MGQVQELRRAGEFPQLIWKDTPPQHFDTTFGEYPEDAPKPPMEVTLAPAHPWKCAGFQDMLMLNEILHCI